MEEEWRPIPGFDIYEASNLGRIRNIGSKYVRIPCLSRHGYARLCIRHKHKNHTLTVHKLVCLAFLGPPEGRHINHKNFHRDDNRLENLEYVTPAQNNRHSIEADRKPRKYRKRTFKVCPQCGYSNPPDY